MTSLTINADLPKMETRVERKRTFFALGLVRFKSEHAPVQNPCTAPENMDVLGLLIVQDAEQRTESPADQD